MFPLSCVTVTQKKYQQYELHLHFFEFSPLVTFPFTVGDVIESLQY
jgi:hypothetical protein